MILHRKGPDGIVVGGGVVGLACAASLSARGYRIRVFEREGFGSGATGAAAGMLAPIAEGVQPDFFEDVLVQAFHALLEALPRLEEATGIRVGLSPGGLIHLPLQSREHARLREVAARYRRRNWPVRWLEVDEARQLFPHLRIQTPVLSTFTERHLLPEALARAYARLARLHGAELVSGEEVTRVIPRRGYVEVRTRSGRHRAAWVVLAAGAWSARVLPPPLRPFVPVFPVRGQMIAFAGVMAPVIVWTSRGYALPKGTFQYVGATVEPVGFRNRITREGRNRMIRLARQMFPELAHRDPEIQWAGLRPGTPDLLPVVGKIPDTEIIVATGHYRNGILLSELTARWVVRFVEGDPPEEATPFAPTRFHP